MLIGFQLPSIKNILVEFGLLQEKITKKQNIDFSCIEFSEENEITLANLYLVGKNVRGSF